MNALSHATITTQTGCGCGCGGHEPCLAVGEPRGLERTRYFSRMLVGPADLTQDQRYARAARRRAFHG